MTTKVELVEGLELADQDVEHFVCCRDEHRTYCGKHDPTRMAGWVDEVSCEECMAIDRADILAEFCPVYPVCKGPWKQTNYCRRESGI